MKAVQIYFSVLCGRRGLHDFHSTIWNCLSSYAFGNFLFLRVDEVRAQIETVADTSLNDMPVYGVQRAIFSIKWNEYTIVFRLEQVLEGISFFTIMLKQFNILKQFGNGGK